MIHTGILVRMLGRSPPITFTPLHHVRSAVGWAAHGLLQVQSSNCWIRVRANLNISNKRRFEEIISQGSMTACQNSNPELRFKTVTQSESTQREQKSTKSRGESAALQIDLLQQHTYLTGTKSDQVAETFIKVIATQIQVSVQWNHCAVQKGSQLQMTM